MTLGQHTVPPRGNLRGFPVCALLLGDTGAREEAVWADFLSQTTRELIALAPL